MDYDAHLRRRPQGRRSQRRPGEKRTAACESYHLLLRVGEP